MVIFSYSQINRTGTIFVQSCNHLFVTKFITSNLYHNIHSSSRRVVSLASRIFISPSPHPYLPKYLKNYQMICWNIKFAPKAEYIISKIRPLHIMFHF